MNILDVGTGSVSSVLGLLCTQIENQHFSRTKTELVVFILGKE